MVENSINGTFLHHREFIEYHEDKFEDVSLVFFEGGHPIAVFPAEVNNGQVSSHRGLTYEGWIVIGGLSQETLRKMVLGTIRWYQSRGFQTMAIKSVPEFLCRGSQKDLIEAIQSTDPEISEKAVFHTTALPYQITDRGRKWGQKKAIAFGLELKVSDDFEGFWEKVLEPLLEDKFQNTPVHSLKEILLLKSRFPENIMIYTAYKDGEILAGTVLFIDRGFLHAQYIASTKNGRKYRALDLLFAGIIEEFKSNKKHLSLGSSCDSRTGIPIPGLVRWKESLGAIPVEVPRFYWRFNPNSSID